MAYTIAGRTNSNGTITPHVSVAVKQVRAGDIVYEGGEWYRVYEGGDKGLRFWNVTAKYANAVHIQTNPHVGMPVHGENELCGAGW